MLSLTSTSRSTGSRLRIRPPASLSERVPRSSTRRSTVRAAVEDPAHVLRVGRVDAVGDRLGLAPDDRQRRPQLVGHLGQEGAAPRLRRLQPGAHRVEGARQVGETPQPPSLSRAEKSPFSTRRAASVACRASGQGFDWPPRCQDHQREEAGGQQLALDRHREHQVADEVEDGLHDRHDHEQPDREEQQPGPSAVRPRPRTQEGGPVGGQGSPSGHQGGRLRGRRQRRPGPITGRGPRSGSRHRRR